MYSGNHRTVEARRDLWRSSSPNPYSSRVPQSPLPSIMSWNISRERDSTTSLRSLFQSSVTLIVKMFFLMFRQNFPCFSSCQLPLVLSLGNTEQVSKSGIKALESQCGICGSQSVTQFNTNIYFKNNLFLNSTGQHGVTCSQGTT